ncbi:hypothetical protein [Algoriphagus sediminis]|uniref:Uncharacterized protein n=1 Tax=Algoriphagus sediminis TaxID=3057113 RepID=A0ABT7YGD7_9BACT|nr:hypothetical protein [Algoriphagus sediminis]MDN3205597.1 hypothetical protein [Algoriphagus sediminis]
MRKVFKPAPILFCFLSLVVFFFVGIYLAVLTGAGDGQMLAAGAIVLMWGVISAGIALVLSLFFAFNLPHRIIVKANWILLGLLLVFYAITHYRYSVRQEEQEQRRIEEEKERERRQTKPAEPVGMWKDQEHQNYLLTSLSKFAPEDKDQLGIGFFKPDFFQFQTLYFYGGVNLEKSRMDHMPQDSLCFSPAGELAPTIEYAPPWLVPEYLKMDYQVLFFKVLGVGYDFVKVEVNKTNGQTAFLDKSQGEFLNWAEFLLSIHSVEFLDPETGNVHLKPLSYASTVNKKFDFMQPLLVEEDWMFVRLLTDGMVEQGKGWIQWKKDGELMISYSIFG